MRHLAGMIVVLAVAIVAWVFMRGSESQVTQRPPEDSVQRDAAAASKAAKQSTPEIDEPRPNNEVDVAPPEPRDDVSPAADPQGDDPADPVDEPPRNEETAPTVTPPWQKSLAAEPAPHLRFQFQPLGDERRHIDQATLADWLEPAGPGGTLRQSRGRPVAMEGLFRLKAPWPEQAVLRMNFGARSKGIRIHFFSQQHGVLVLNSLSPRERWNAYLTQRIRPDALPDDRRLAADDRSRGRLLRGRRHAPLEFHWSEGLLRMVHGGATLLAAPLPGPPTEVFFEGTATVYGIDMRRASTTPELPHRISSELEPLRGLTWNRESLAEGVRFEEAADGSLILDVPTKSEPGWAFAKLPPALQHVELEVEAERGFGVYLANEDGAPGEMVRWGHNERDEGRLTAYRTEDRRQEKQRLGRLPQNPPASVGTRHWVRLMAGPRSLQWWVGQDGQHWAAPDVGSARRRLSGATLGVMYGANTTGKLRIRQIRVAPLAGLAQFGETLLQRSPATGELAPPYESAEDVAADVWRRIIAGNVRDDDPRTLYAGALRQSVAKRRQLLVELSRWLAIEGNTRDHQWLTDEAAALAHEAWELDGTAPWSWCLATLQALDLPSSHFPPERYEPLQLLLRREVLGLAAQQRWDELVHTVDRAIFHGERPTPLLAWAGSAAERHSTRALQTEAVRGSVHRGAPLWTDQIDKPTFNLLVELQGLIDSEAWDAAAELSTRATELRGLAPDPRDAELLTSFTNRLAQVCREHPELCKAMEKGAQQIAQLYLNRAVASGDVGAVRRAARQFPATPAAAEAWVWAGDQALVTGDAAGAAAAYRTAAQQDPYVELSPFKRALVADTFDLEMRQATETQQWMLGGQALPASEARELLSGLPAASWKPPPMESAATLPEQAAAEARGKLETPFGRDPRQQVMRYVNERGVDWCGRQLSVVTDDARLFVCNRFQLACFDEQGQRLWQTSEPNDPKLTAQRAREISRTPCRPVLHQGQLTARLLYGSGGILQSVAVQDGTTLWRKRPGPNQRWASDPVLSQGKLWAAVLEQTSGIGDLELSLAQLRPHDGQQIASQRLGQVRQEWLQDQHCQISPLPEGVLLSVGDAHLRVDRAGICWLRRRSTPPSEQDPRRPLEWIEPPLLSADAERVILRRPGLPLVQCLQAETGELLWERLAPGLASVPAMREDRILVWTDERLEAWSIDDGGVLWSKPWRKRCRGMVSLPEWGVFAELAESVEQLPIWAHTGPVQRLPRPEGPQFAIQWRDWGTGRVLRTTQLEGFSGKLSRVARLIPTANHWWVFEGDGPLDATRTLHQLAPR